VTSGDQPGENMPFFDLRSLLGGAANDPWAGATELAAAIASEGGTEPNLDPLVRMRIEDLVRVAELHVAQATGIVAPSNTVVTPVTRGEWTRRSIAAYRPFFERFGEALGTASPATPAGDPMAMMMGQLFQALGPALVSASAGSLIGHLGQRAMGQYDLPVPRNSPEVLVVPHTIDATAAEWEVPVDDLRLWVLVHELSTHAVLTRPHVGKRMVTLLIDFAAAFRPNPEAIADQFASLESMTDLSQLQEMAQSLSDPDLVLSLMRSPAHELLIPQFDALVASILGYVAHIVDVICSQLVASHPAIKICFRKRWTEGAPADRFMERLLGLEITERTLNRGDRFVDGIVTRAGDEGLARLWADELDLPTAAEVEAPGLWLARIGFDADAGTARLEIPDDLSGLDDNL
jgi:putative hydrolase